MTSVAVLDGVIDGDKAYALRAFQQLTGMGTAALREARRNGLTVRRVGLRSFILGRDFLDYLAKHGKVVVSEGRTNSSERQ